MEKLTLSSKQQVYKPSFQKYSVIWSPCVLKTTKQTHTICLKKNKIKQILRLCFIVVNFIYLSLKYLYISTIIARQCIQILNFIFRT